MKDKKLFLSLLNSLFNIHNVKLNKFVLQTFNKQKTKVNKFVFVNCNEAKLLKLQIKRTFLLLEQNSLKGVFFLITYKILR